MKSSTLAVLFVAPAGWAGLLVEMLPSCSPLEAKEPHFLGQAGAFGHFFSMPLVLLQCCSPPWLLTAGRTAVETNTQPSLEWPNIQRECLFAAHGNVKTGCDGKQRHLFQLKNLF